MTTATQARLKNAAHAAALAAAAVLVRLWGLGEQSLAWDDYNGLVGLSEDSLLASVALARQVNPEGAPLYHVVQWLASLLIGDRITVRRSDHRVRFLHPRGWNYYATLRRKLHWNEGALPGDGGQ